MKVSEAKRLKQIEVENRRLKKLVADLSLDRTGNGEARRTASRSRLACDRHRVSVRRACHVIRLAESTFRYRSCRSEPDGLRDRLLELAAERPRFGYRRLHTLLVREGWAVNHKRIPRMYREESLSVRRKKRKRVASRPRQRRKLPAAANERWSVVSRRTA